ncbi:hypothetical protein KR093_002642 [Drosophila rubida]|uniref:Uncharacterized protein n=1 Tax=Drosophila rubida TaxID=30044 RepID=A0AAD4PQG8_9MUSC|nr:hypothetical protein KR093_002642 [Drosophila rubida]
MYVRSASRSYNESEIDVISFIRDHDHESEEDLVPIDETVKNVSRNMRKGDWAYLCRHPEVRAIIRVIVTEAIRTHPKNFYKFVADLFCCSNQKKVCRKINKQIRWISLQGKSSSWMPADGPMEFSESSGSVDEIIKPTECGPASGPTPGRTPFAQPFDEERMMDELYLKTHISPDHFKPSC